MAEEVHLTKATESRFGGGQPSFKVLGTTNVCRTVAGLTP